MPTRRRVGGYVFNGEVARVRRGVRQVRKATRAINGIVRGRLPGVCALLVEVALALGDMEDALSEIERIAGEGRA